MIADKPVIESSSQSRVRRKVWSHILVSPYSLAILAIAILLVVGQLLSPGFASLDNVGNILASSTILTLAGLGQTLVILAGDEGIDLSIGALLSLGALLGGAFSGGSDGGLLPAVLMLIGLGAIVGVLNGIGVQWLKVPPLVMTLGMSSVVNGFALAYTQGQPTGSAPPALLSLGTGHLIGPLRWLVVLGVIVVVLAEWVLKRTPYGRKLFLVGNNRRAAYLSGLPISRTVIITYIATGVCSILAGLVLLGFAGSSNLQIGSDYTLLSIAAVVIGGTRLTGGDGSYIGTALGAIVLVMLTSVLLALRLSEGVRVFIEGALLLGLLIVYHTGAYKLRT